MNNKSLATLYSYLFLSVRPPEFGGLIREDVLIRVIFPRKQRAH